MSPFGNIAVLSNWLLLISKDHYPLPQQRDGIIILNFVILALNLSLLPFFLSRLNFKFYVILCWLVSGPQAYERRYSTDTRAEPMHWVLSPLALNLRIELTSPTDCKRVYNTSSLFSLSKNSEHPYRYLIMMSWRGENIRAWKRSPHNIIRPEERV